MGLFDWFNKAVETVKNAVSNVVNTISNAVDSAIDWIEEHTNIDLPEPNEERGYEPTKPTIDLETPVKQAGQAISNAVNEAKEVVETGIKTIEEGAKNLASTVTKTVENGVKTITNTISNLNKPDIKEPPKIPDTDYLPSPDTPLPTGRLKHSYPHGIPLHETVITIPETKPAYEVLGYDRKEYELLYQAWKEKQNLEKAKQNIISLNNTLTIQAQEFEKHKNELIQQITQEKQRIQQFLNKLNPYDNIVYKVKIGDKEYSEYEAIKILQQELNKLDKIQQEILNAKPEIKIDYAGKTYTFNSFKEAQKFLTNIHNELNNKETELEKQFKEAWIQYEKAKHEYGSENDLLDIGESAAIGAGTAVLISLALAPFTGGISLAGLGLAAGIGAVSGAAGQVAGEIVAAKTGRQDLALLADIGTGVITGIGLSKIASKAIEASTKTASIALLESESKEIDENLIKSNIRGKVLIEYKNPIKRVIRLYDLEAEQNTKITARATKKINNNIIYELYGYESDTKGLLILRDQKDNLILKPKPKDELLSFYDRDFGNEGLLRIITNKGELRIKDIKALGYVDDKTLAIKGVKTEIKAPIEEELYFNKGLSKEGKYAGFGKTKRVGNIALSEGTLGGDNYIIYYKDIYYPKNINIKIDRKPFLIIESLEKETQEVAEEASKFNKNLNKALNIIKEDANKLKNVGEDLSKNIGNGGEIQLTKTVTKEGENVKQLQKVLTRTINNIAKQEEKELTKTTFRTLLSNTILSNLERTTIKSQEFNIKLKQIQKTGTIQLQKEKLKLKEVNTNVEKLFSPERIELKKVSIPKQKTIEIQKNELKLDEDYSFDLSFKPITIEKQLLIEKIKYEEPKLNNYFPKLPAIPNIDFNIRRINFRLPSFGTLLGNYWRRPYRYYYYERKNPIADPKELLKRLW